MLQGYFLARDHIYICDKLRMVLQKRMKSICVATFPDVRDEMAVTFLETCVHKKQVECLGTL